MGYLKTIGPGVLLVALAAGGAGADVIHLTNGNTIEVAAWRDAGDAIEFASGGGIIRIAKSDIVRVEGRTISSDLRMRSAPAPAVAAVAPVGAEAGSVVKAMLDLLQQGEGLFGQTVLSAADKARAFRKLREGWDGLEVPDAVKELHGKGQQAIQIAAEAFVAAEEDVVPNVKERVEAARKAIQDAHADVKKASEPKS